MSISGILAFSVSIFSIFGKKVKIGERSFLLFEEPDFTRF